MKNEQPNTAHHADEFMTAAEFKTYNYILGVVKSVELKRKKKGTWRADDPPTFYGCITTTAAKTGQSESTVSRNVARLVRSGWLTLIPNSERNRSGNFSTRHYRVLKVDEWLVDHEYSKVKRAQNRGFRKMNMRRYLAASGLTFEVGTRAECLLNTVVDQDKDTQNAARQNVLSRRTAECVSRRGHILRCRRGHKCVHKLFRF